MCSSDLRRRRVESVNRVFSGGGALTLKLAKHETNDRIRHQAPQAHRGCNNNARGGVVVASSQLLAQQHPLTLGRHVNPQIGLNSRSIKAESKGNGMQKTQENNRRA